jgi:hypothetical protein
MSTSHLLLLFVLGGSLAAAQDAAIRPGGPPRPAPRPKLQEGGAYQGQFPTTVEGDYFEEFQGEHEIETIIIPSPQGPRPVVIYNRPPGFLRPPPTPGAPLPQMVVPWHDIIAFGPDDPGAPLPYLEPVPTDFVMSVSMQVQVINDLALLPTGADRGQGMWQIEWEDLSADFLSLGGRYYLLTADVPLADLVPEPGTAFMALVAAAVLARLRRRF